MGNFDDVKPAENYSEKCLCVLVLDTSASMSGEPIAQLQEGISLLQQELAKDAVASERVEVCIVTFDAEVDCIQEPVRAELFQAPTFGHLGGSTRLVDGVREGIRQIDERKAYYKQNGIKYYRPWLMLITDGQPDEGQDIEGIEGEIADGIAQKKFLFYSIGVQGADFDVLKKISDKNTPPMELSGLKFQELFKWLSQSMTMVSRSKSEEAVTLPDASGWGQISC